MRNGGQSIPNLAGKYLGSPVKVFINILALVLLLLVGVVFVASPAQLLSTLTIDNAGISVNGGEPTVFGMNKTQLLATWTFIIFAYYIIATLLPIDKIIGKIYPLFGALLLFMTVGMIYGLISSHLNSSDPVDFYRTVNTDGLGLTAEKFFQNFQIKDNLPIWPLLFLTISCGALSGFHATQTPLMVRCAQNEKDGRFIFYGAMIAEGIIALVWCAVGLSFYQDPQEMAQAIAAGSPSKLVYDSSIYFLGAVGGVFAILGVVILPITSGDTAFRAARLIIAEFFNLDQKPIIKRLVISIPMFALGFIISKTDFSDLWSYFTWANQTTAMVMLWTAGAYLYRYNKFHWVCTLPAMFITAVCFTYLMFHKVGFGLDYQLSVYIGLIITGIITILFFK